MNTIWKFPFEVTDYFNLSLPQGAKILTVQIQHGAPHVWVYLDPSQPTEVRSFRVAGTGHEIEPRLDYIGTFQMHGGMLVFHLFEL
jgi:hypothetical protein